MAVAQQQATTAHIRFVFENPKLQPGSYVLDINEDGTGHFKSEPGSEASPDAEGIAPQGVNTDIKIEEPLRNSLFKTARSHNHFDVACESTKSKVAFTGKKVLQYNGPDGQGSCTFNWSHDQQLMKVVDDLIAVAFTLEEGRRLAVEHEHNRLGLDAELAELQDAMKAGRAQQIQNISPQLEAIAADESVMQRARLRARQLLAGDVKPS
ncbi:hypothetical protein H7849_09555 [Alloacidobacterium dinghuense]|uniref:Uncharacterized protein n=1 Tax=Alloacidobacterium dinghuense TaxID=2763107 RepID=A0A7G8BNK1_9BACT|nr:hypothetical protein [Alloacidobacterium dinghuense]QNI34121.1 hypothetical protein H7849_09555 [Alloacidobacterium dinghuense]